jgi:phosphoserine phosphatase RsbU/P
LAILLWREACTMSLDREEKLDSARKAEIARFGLELAEARELHRSSLPLSNPVIEGYGIAGFNAAAADVRADYYDFLPYKDGRLGIVIADVSSRGLNAARFAAMLKKELGNQVESGADPLSAVEALNRIMYDTVASGMYATLIFGVLTPESGLFRYCNAGHDAGMLVRSDGRTDLVEATGAPVGIIESLEWDLNEVIIEPGDTLALVTDGIVEARNREDEDFGNERVAGYVSANMGRPCTQMAAELTDRVLEWIGDADNYDDLALVLVCRKVATT